MTETRLHSEYLPSCGEASLDLVLLHGWASSREIWRPLLAKLRDWANVTLIDMPLGCDSESDLSAGDLNVLEQSILACSVGPAIYVGWSLGGQVAIRLAGSAPGRVSGVITLCSNPCFVATENWPGMATEDFARFRERVVANPVSALRRFDSLQTEGSLQPRSSRRDLQSARPSLDRGQLMAGLELLQSLDVRASLMALKQPQLHIFGECDHLVPPAVATAIVGLTDELTTLETITLPGVSHAAPLESAAAVATVMYEYLNTAGLLHRTVVHDSEPAKTEVAQSFSKAAQHYDSAAQLQREVGARLLDKCYKSVPAPELILDLGCGTGYFFSDLKKLFPDANYVGLDLAPGMVEFARERVDGPAQWLVADAESLPLAGNSVDLVFSSLAIQWCPAPRRLFAELARILKPGGRCLFSSLGPATLRELRASWAAVDAHQHVNTFQDVSVLEEAAAVVPGVSLRLDNQEFLMEYDRVRELLTELKTLGAHNMNRGRLSGLTGRRKLQGMLTAYESWRRDGKLPATYDVLFGVLEKA